MIKFKFTLTNILYWVGTIAAILIFENLDFFTKLHGKYGPLPNNAFAILFLVVVISYLTMFILDFVYNKSKFSYIGFVVFSVFLSAMIIAIYKFQGMSFKGFAPDYYLSDYDRVRQSLTSLCYILTLFATFTVLINNHPSIKRLKYLFIIAMIFCYVLIILTFILEGDAYKAINSGHPDGVKIQSIFYNSNMFAAILLLGIASAIGLNYFKKNVFSYLSVLFFFVIQVYVKSLACILISLVIILAFYFVEILFNFKKRPKLAMIEMSIYVTIVVGAVVTLVAANATYVGGLSDFCHYLFNELFQSSYSTFSDRIYLWQYVLDLIRAGRTVFLFGYGPLNGDWVLGGYRLMQGRSFNDSYRISAHSAYMQILLNYGVFGALLYLTLIVFYFYCLIRLFKKNKRFCTLFLLMALIYFAFDVTESFIPFGMNAQGIVIGVFVFLPVIAKYRHYRRPQISKDVIKSEVPALLDPALMVRKTARLFLAVISAVAIYFIFPINYQIESNMYLLTNILVMLGIGLLTIPYLSGLWSKNTSVNKYLLRTFLNVMLLGLAAGVSAAFFILFGYQSFDSTRWFIPGIIIFVLFLQLIIYSVIKHGSFKLYLNTFIAFKTCLSSLLVSAGFALLCVFVDVKFLPIESPYTLIGLPILTILIFYVSSFIVPFKDTREIINYENSYDFTLLKREVVREQLRNA